MADLEDFFAKRDKKKKSKGGSKKFETADDVAKALDARAKERKKNETYQPSQAEVPEGSVSEYRAKENEDEEWKEHVEEKPDYTGLKIQELILEDEDEELEETTTNGPQGPWSKNKPTEEKKPEIIEPTVVVPEPTQSTSVSVAAPTSTPVSTAEGPLEEGKGSTTTTPTPPESSSDQPTGTVIEESSETTATTENLEGEGASTEKSIEDDASAAGTTTAAAPEPKKYIPPSLRAKMEEEAKRAAAATASATTVEPISAPRVAPQLASTGGPSGGRAYVPPNRREPTSATPTGFGTRSKKNVAAPNINDEQYFPSLGDALSGKIAERS